MLLLPRNDKIGCISMNILSKCIFIILFLTQNASLKTPRYSQLVNNHNDDLFCTYHLLGTVPSAFHALSQSCKMGTWLSPTLLMRKLRLGEVEWGQIQVANPGLSATRAWPQDSCDTPEWGCACAQDLWHSCPLLGDRTNKRHLFIFSPGVWDLGPSLQMLSASVNNAHRFLTWLRKRQQDLRLSFELGFQW